MPMLDEGKQLLSDLWVDQPDALDRVERRLADDRITDDEATALRHFITEGYLITPLDLDENFAQSFERDINRLWTERPADLAAAPKFGELTSMRDLDASSRDVGSRVADLHAHSPSALSLYLHPRLFRLAELIFDDTPVAFQSLYFEWGSEQGLHRDPMFVPTNPASHLLASWVALEDITEDSGPLIYVPGSHRMPWFEFEPDTVRFTAKDKETRSRWVAHRQQMIDEMGLEVKALTCPRGDAFIWHGGLLHGGMRVADDRCTRKSFVTHYSTAAHYIVRRGHMQMEVDGELQKVGGRTEKLLKVDGRIGFDGPLRTHGVDTEHSDSEGATTSAPPATTAPKGISRRLFRRRAARQRSEPPR